jgi:hypothetical protein
MPLNDAHLGGLILKKMKTTQEVFKDVLEELGFDGYRPKDLTNSDYWMCTTLSMERFANQFITPQDNVIKEEIDFKSKLYNVVFDDGFSSQEKVYELKQLFLNQD